MPYLSIVIRTKNEEKWLGEVLGALTRQTFQDFEVIAVDSGSTDRTLEIFRQFQDKLKIKIFNLPRKFTYPYSCNFGAEQASGEIVGYLSGHSVLASSDGLEKSLVQFQDPKVVGVYGHVLPLGNASWVERLFYTSFMGTTWAKNRLANLQAKKARKPVMGVMGNTNTLYRKSILEKFPFNEQMSRGGEDTEWVMRVMGPNRAVVHDPRLTVYHSHGIGLIGFLRQYNHWRSVTSQAKRLIRSS